MMHMWCCTRLLCINNNHHGTTESPLSLCLLKTPDQRTLRRMEKAQKHMKCVACMGQYHRTMLNREAGRGAMLLVLANESNWANKSSDRDNFRQVAVVLTVSECHHIQSYFQQETKPPLLYSICLWLITTEGIATPDSKKAGTFKKLKHVATFAFGFWVLFPLIWNSRWLNIFACSVCSIPIWYLQGDETQQMESGQIIMNHI